MAFISILLGIIMINQYSDVYCGDWRDNVYDGKGTFVYRSGEKYQGELSKGRKEGHGVYWYLNESEYNGYWKNDLKDGDG